MLLRLNFLVNILYLLFHLKSGVDLQLEDWLLAADMARSQKSLASHILFE